MNPVFALWTGLIVTAFSQSGFAQVNSSTERLEFEFLSNQYLTDGLTTEQANSYQYVLPRFQFSSSGRSQFLYRGDFSGVLPLSEAGESHYLFPEVYAGLRAERGTQAILFGRREFQWSRLDRQLDLGLWQPLFRWDHARSVQMGLTGFFGDWKPFQGFSITALASPLFLPDQQPAFDIVNGRIVSGNRWFRAPISQFEIGNSATEIVYIVNAPEAEDVVFNESFALRMDWAASSGFFAALAVADKPMNQFHLGIDTSQSLRMDRSDRLEPAVYPVVVRHRLMTLEFGIARTDYEIYISHTSENFEDPKLPSDWEQTELIDSSYQGLGLRHDFWLPFLPSGKLAWSYARRARVKSGGDSMRIEGQIEASTQRMAFKEWASVTWEWEKPLPKGRSLAANLGYNYYPVDEASWLSFDLRLQTYRNWAWYLGGDILGVEKPTYSENESFPSIYSHNDRIQGGFTYVF